MNKRLRNITTQFKKNRTISEQTIKKHHNSIKKNRTISEQTIKKHHNYSINTNIKTKYEKKTTTARTHRHMLGSIVSYSYSDLIH